MPKLEPVKIERNIKVALEYLPLDGDLLVYKMKSPLGGTQEGFIWRKNLSGVGKGKDIVTEAKRPSLKEHETIGGYHPVLAQELLPLNEYSQPHKIHHKKPYTAVLEGKATVKDLYWWSGGDHCLLTRDLEIYPSPIQFGRRCNMDISSRYYDIAKVRDKLLKMNSVEFVDPDEPLSRVPYYNVEICGQYEMNFTWTPTKKQCKEMLPIMRYWCSYQMAQHIKTHYLKIDKFKREPVECD